MFSFKTPEQKVCSVLAGRWVWSWVGYIDAPQHLTAASPLGSSPKSFPSSGAFILCLCPGSNQCWPYVVCLKAQLFWGWPLYLAPEGQYSLSCHLSWEGMLKQDTQLLLLKGDNPLSIPFCLISFSWFGESFSYQSTQNKLDICIECSY